VGVGSGVGEGVTVLITSPGVEGVSSVASSSSQARKSKGKRKTTAASARPRQARRTDESRGARELLTPP